MNTDPSRDKVVAEMQRLLDERNAELRASHAELAKTNSELMQLTLELEDRVAQRTAELSEANQALRSEVAEHKRTEEALKEASHAKNQFIATLSHELRTPLTPVLLTTSSLENDPALSAELRAQLSLIRSHIEVEVRLIDDLLDLTKITHGKFSVRCQNLNASDVLAAALETVRAVCLEKKIRVQLDGSASSTAVKADPIRLQQVFWNLLHNAIKFTAGGGDIYVRSFNPTPNRLAIEIRDTGIGISSEFMEQVFQPFHQGAVAGNPQFGGLGLGLSISKSIIEAHGGRITASSAGSKRGTTFTVELPLCEQVGKNNNNNQAAPPKAISSPRRILLVEDHAATRGVLSHLLRKDGHQVTAVGCCAEAMHAADSQPAGEPFEALVCDLGLPDGSGLDVVRRVKAGAPSIAAVALSGFGTDDDLRRSKEAGFDQHLVKPASIQELRRALIT